MRVCLVTLDFPPFRSSGLTIYAEQLTRGLAARGHRITVVAAERPAAASLDQIPLPEAVEIIRVPVGSADWIGLGWHAARWLAAQSGRFDLVHFADVHFAYAYPHPYVATAWQSFRQRLTCAGGLPYHTGWRNLAFRWIYYTAARWLMELPSVRRARSVLMPSHSTQVEFLKHYGINLNRAPLVYPGMDLDRFRQLPERRQARAYLALSEDLPVVLYVGFSTPRKGVEHLAQAMRAIPSTQLLMVGKWEAGYQQRFMAALGESHSRTTLAGYVPESEMLWYYAAADVLVLPTLLEGVGLPSIEAMAAGLPVVTTTGGAAGEIVGPGGIAVTPADSVALAAAIDRVLGDSDLARQLGDAGRQRAFSLFDLAAASQRVETIYQRALEQGA